MTRILSMLAGLMISSVSAADDGPLFFDMGIGQTFFHIPEQDTNRLFADDDTDGTWPARSLRLGGGLTIGNVVSVGTTFWLWGDSDLLDDEEEEESDSTSERSNPNPELWGSGADVFARVGIPFKASGSGPYFEYGRLCWAARITNLADPWKRNGCTARRGFGIAFFSSKDSVSNSESESAFRLAFHRTNFDEVDLYQFMIDAQFRF